MQETQEGFLCVFSPILRGTTNCRRRVRPDGAALFLHRLSRVRELRQRVRPFRAGSFSLNLSGEFALSLRSADSPRPGRGQEGRHQGFYPLTPTSFGRVWRRLPTCDRCETGERQSGYRSVCFGKLIRSSQTAYCYTYRVNQRIVRHNRAAQFVSAL